MFLRLTSPELALRRIAARVKQGGPDVAGEGTMKAPKKPRAQSFAAAVGRALRRAGVTARRTARMHGTPLCVWKDGKIVAEKP